MIQRCGSASSVKNTRSMKRHIDTSMMSLERASAEGDDPIYVRIVYYVLYRTDAENISLDLIRSQHHMINLCFSNQHESRNRMPTTGHEYNFSSAVGTSNIRFLPTVHTDLKEEDIVRIPMEGRTDVFKNLIDVLEFYTDLNRDLVNGSINLFIVPFQNLGEAETPGDLACIATSSVGGELEQGTLKGYDKGITAVHEIGHLFGLPHVFDGDCDRAFADIPAQKYESPYFQLTEEGGTWSGKQCNRYIDCKIYKEGDTSFEIDGLTKPYSCFPCDVDGAGCTECDTSEYEQSMNFMDYAQDDHLIMFSREQSIFMRQVLLSKSGKVEPVSDGAETSTAQVDDADVKTTDPKFSTWAIVGMVAGGSVVIIVIAVLIALKLRKK